MSRGPDKTASNAASLWGVLCDSLVGGRMNEVYTMCSSIQKEECGDVVLIPTERTVLDDTKLIFNSIVLEHVDLSKEYQQIDIEHKPKTINWTDVDDELNDMSSEVHSTTKRKRTTTSQSLKRPHIRNEKLLLLLDGHRDLFEWRYSGNVIDISKDWRCLQPWVSNAITSGLEMLNKSEEPGECKALTAIEGLPVRSSLGIFTRSMEEIQSSGTSRAVVVPTIRLVELESIALVLQKVGKDLPHQELTRLALHSDRVLISLDRDAQNSDVCLLSEQWRPQWITSQHSTISITSLPPGLSCEVRRVPKTW